jgi:GxxExxY protein
VTAEQLNVISRDIIACAIKIHKYFGPGLLESIYRKATAIELRKMNYKVLEEVEINAAYEGQNLGLAFRMDLLVQDSVATECKAVDALVPVNSMQLKSQLVLADLRLGLLINFREKVLTDGVRRIVNNFPDGRENG